MIHCVIVSLPTGSDSRIYRVIYASGRDVLFLEREAPATVREFLNEHATTARTLRVPHLTDDKKIGYTYCVMYTRY